MLVSVILNIYTVGFYCDLVLLAPVNYFQSAIFRLNLVIVRFRIFIERVREGILRLSYQRLASGDVIGRAFAFHKAVAAYRHIRLRILPQRIAVIFLLAARACQLYAALRDLQLAGNRADVELSGHIVSVCVPDNGCSGDRVRIRSGIRLRYTCRQAFHRVGVAVNFENKCLEAFRRLPASVIHAFRAVGLYFNLILLGPVFYSQRSVHILDVVVCSDVVSVLVLYFGRARHVIACACQCLAAGHSNSHNTVSLCQLRIGITVPGQRSAVVLFLITVSCDGQILRRHLQCSVCVGDRIVTGNILTGRIPDHCRTRDIIAASNCSLAAGHGDRFDLVVLSQLAIRVAVFGQSRSVVDLLITVSCDGQRQRHHFQSAIHICDVIALSNIFTRCVPDHRFFRGVVTLANICLAACHDDCVKIVTFCQVRTRISVFGQRSAVIHL